MPVPLSDLRDGARLAVAAVTGVTDVVEAVQAQIMLRPQRRAPGLWGFIYHSIRQVTRGVGRALDRSFEVAGWLVDDAPAVPADADVPALLAAVESALDGAIGDRLAAQGSPLAIPLHLRHGGAPLTVTGEGVAAGVPEPRPTVLVMVHGLCMNDLQWRDAAHDQGAVLADALGATRVAARYNTGRRIAANGRDLAATLQALVDAWPVPPERLVLVGHSMGGLVLRAALHHAAGAAHTWPRRRVDLVTLGTPHHGAALSRIGNLVDARLGAFRVTAPLLRLSQVRSEGMTDLRFGIVRPEDDAPARRFAVGRDHRTPTPLPDGVTAYLVAATLGDGTGGRRDRTVGDGLVQLASALGDHPDPRHDLGVPAARRAVFPGVSHFGMLWSPAVTAQLVRWLADGAPADGRGQTADGERQDG